MFAPEFVSKQEPLKKLVSIKTLQTSSCSVIVALVNVNEIKIPHTVIQSNSSTIEQNGNWIHAQQQKPTSSFSTSHAASSTNLSSTFGSTPISGSDSGGLDLCLFEQHSHQSAQASSIEREKSPPSKGSWPQHGPPSSCTLHRQQLVCVRTLTKMATKPKVRKLKYNTPPTTKRTVGAIVICALKKRETLEPKLPHTHPRQNSIPLAHAQLNVEKVNDCDLLSDDCLAFRLNLPSCFLIEPLHDLLRSKLSSTLSNQQEHTSTESLIQTTVMLVANCLQAFFLALRRANLHSYQLGLNPTKVTQSRKTFYRKYLVVNSRGCVCKSSLQPSKTSVCGALVNVKAITLLHTVIQPNSCPIGRNGNRVRTQKPTSSSSTSHAANLSSTLGSTPISGSDSGGRDDEEDEEEEKKNPLPASPGIESGLLSILIRIIDFICFVVCLWRGENMDFRVIFDTLWRVTLMSLPPHFFHHSHQSAQAPSIERENLL